VNEKIMGLIIYFSCSFFGVCMQNHLHMSFCLHRAQALVRSEVTKNLAFWPELLRINPDSSLPLALRMT